MIVFFFNCKLCRVVRNSTHSELVSSDILQSECNCSQPAAKKNMFRYNSENY